MPATVKVPLGASTQVRKWYLDVNTGTHAAPVWLGVFGQKEFKPNYESHLEDDSDFDSGGYSSSTKTAEAWSVEGKYGRKSQESDPTAYDPGQEYLRLHSIGKMGSAARVEIRFYEMQPGGPRVEAYQGYATVGWAPEGGAQDANDDVTVTLTGQGQLTPITHPDAGAAVAAVALLSPANGGVAGGNLVIITGSGFVGASDVKFATTSATGFSVISNGKIAAVAPAHTAGQVDVTVVNAAGTSGVSAATKYTYA